VVDSGSTDGAVDYIKSMPVKLIQIEPKKFNYSKAFNSGSKIAKGEFLIRLSGDCIPVNKDFLRELLKPFDNPKVGGTYGKYTITGKEGWGYPIYWPASRFSDKEYTISIKPYLSMGLFESYSTKQKLFALAGGCCTIRKEIWLKKPFNEKMIGYEDAEYAWSLHLIGYDIVYVPKAIVIHEHKIKKGQKSKDFSLGLILFSWQIAKYWFLRLFFVDLYKNLKD